MRTSVKLTLLVVGCALAVTRATATSSEPVVPFDASEAAWFKTKGTNTLTGSAYLKAADGSMHNCSSGGFGLVPVTKYMTARLKITFGGAAGDFISYARMTAPPKADPAAESFSVLKLCDETGHFTVGELPDGEYYITAQVAWRSADGTPAASGQRIDGGIFVRRFKLSGGERLNIDFKQ